MTIFVGGSGIGPTWQGMAGAEMSNPLGPAGLPRYRFPHTTGCAAQTHSGPHQSVLSQIGRSSCEFTRIFYFFPRATSEGFSFSTLTAGVELRAARGEVTRLLKSRKSFKNSPAFGRKFKGPAAGSRRIESRLVCVFWPTEKQSSRLVG